VSATPSCYSTPYLIALVPTLRHRARAVHFRNCDFINSFSHHTSSPVLIRIITHHTSHHIPGIDQHSACNRLSSTDSSADHTSTALVTSASSPIALATYAPAPLSWAFCRLPQSLPFLSPALLPVRTPARSFRNCCFLHPYFPPLGSYRISSFIFFCGNGRLEFAPFFSSNSIFLCRYPSCLPLSP